MPAYQILCKLFLLVKAKNVSSQSCTTLCDPMYYSLSGFSVHGIFQARIMGVVAIPFSRGYSRTRNLTQVSHIASRFFTGWVTREAPFINSTLSKYSHIHSCTGYLWILSHYTDSWIVAEVTYSPQNLRYLLSGLLQKSLLTLTQEFSSHFPVSYLTLMQWCDTLHGYHHCSWYSLSIQIFMLLVSLEATNIGAFRITCLQPCLSECQICLGVIFKDICVHFIFLTQ